MSDSYQSHGEGAAQPDPQPVQPEPGLWRAPAATKSVVLAGFMSVFCGLGHVYLGYYRRGFVHFLVFFGIVGVLSSPGGGRVAPLLGPFLGFFWCYNVLDAIRRANAYNRAVLGNAIGGEDILMPDEGFGRTAGLLITGLGVFLLMHTRFDFDFYWLEEWWPVGLILIGANILWRHQKGERT